MANQYRSVLASGSASTGGDALPAEVLAGKTFTNDNGAQTGTMTNNGAVSESLSFGQSYTVPEGYHNGQGTITAPSAYTPEKFISIIWVFGAGGSFTGYSYNNGVDTSFASQAQIPADSIIEFDSPNYKFTEDGTYLIIENGNTDLTTIATKSAGDTFTSANSSGTAAITIIKLS